MTVSLSKLTKLEKDIIIGIVHCTTLLLFIKQNVTLTTTTHSLHMLLYKQYTHHIVGKKYF